MKQTNHLSKRVLSLVLVLMMLISAVPMAAFAAGTEGSTVYLVPSTNWKNDNARFAVYYWNDGGNAWVSMTSSEDVEGMYEAVIPAGYTNIIFCRMNPGTTGNNWNNKWNQTADLTMPTDGTNRYTVAEGTWDKGGGAWDTYTPPVENVLYLKPNSNWLVDGARFAAYFFGNGETWVDMTDEDGDGYYECEAPEGYPSVIFCRMNPGTTENNWDNKWNQTADLTVPTDDTNCYTVADGTWDKGGGTWSVYPPEEEVPETSEPEETEPDAVYYVAGDSTLCGSNWDAADAANKMTCADGVYTKVYTNVAAGTYNIKVTDGTWTNSWGDNGQNYTFVVSSACDVTVTFNAGTQTVSVTGDSVTKPTALEITTMHAVGNGSGSWLGGENWDVTANVMKETSDNVYEITFENVPAGSAYEFKFAANGAWTHSWGSGGAEGEAVYNGQNIKLNLDKDSNVTLKLDLSGYDYSTKTGATYAVTVTDAAGEPEPTADYYLYGYVNSADISSNEDGYKFVDSKLTASFTAADNYVFVKNAEGTAYMAAEYCTDTTVTLAAGNDEKLYVPGNVEVTFTLVENADGTLTLSYAKAAAEEPEFPEEYTVVSIHFLKTEGWGSGINAYVWTDGGALAGYEAYNTWPGKAVAENASHPGWYDLTVGTEDPTAFNFIFNDGGNQTADLATGVVTGDTELWVIGSDVMTTAPGEWTGDYDYTANIYFQKPDGWGDTINAWIWDANGKIPGYEDYNTTWPGKAVEEDAVNEGWYKVSVTVAENTGFSFIFNDGSNQTEDLSTGTLDVTTNLWVVNGEVLTTAPAGFVDPNRKVYVPGTFPGPSWDAGSNQMTFDPELGLYTCTFQDVPAANYEFKIAINGSWNENYGAGGVKDGSNIAVTVPETMDVIVYYNDETHNAVTNVSYVFADITLTGTGIPEGTKLTDKGLTGIYSVTVPMAAGTYSDCMLIDDTDGSGKELLFTEFELTEAKDVTFFYDPVSGLFYHNASNEPVERDTIYYNSQDEVYKSPYGAVAVGEEVTFSIDTGADITSAVLVIKGVESYPMTAVTTDAGKRWSAAAVLNNLGEYDYYFALSNGSTVAVYGDDDGYYGEGTVTDLVSVQPYDLVVYEAGYETPDWMKDAVIYQIFPDRFFDGDVTNNQAQTWARGDVNYEYITDWYTLPENPEQEAMLDKDTYLSSGAHYGDGEWSNEIYGGDLKGITERIDYLKALGVNVIYLNPVFWSISNHRYDAVDYTEIDPILGTLGDFEELVAIAEANDMHIILDGVFNHVSDDSVYFDRYYKFLPNAAEKYDGKIGAYPYWAYVYDLMAEDDTLTQKDAEAKAKVYFTQEYGITDYSYTEWFAVSSTKGTNGVYAYEGWWGYDSMPVIKSTNGSEYQTGNWSDEIIDGQNSVNAYWISKGMDGWRLDVANEVSDETWQKFRDSVKALNSDAVIIGEIWDDATKYLMGDMYDSVMNYMFRNAVTSYAMGTGSEATTKALEKIRERYPEEAFYAMMNLVGSHDTTRILSYLDGIGDDRNQKDFDSAFPTYAKTSDTAKARQYLVAFLQFTYPGAPTIYYGDEIGMVGSDDPDDRRAFEWGKGNQELVEWYARLAAIREAYPALRTGDIQPMDLGSSALLAFTRSDDANALIVIANNSGSEATVDNLPAVMSTTGYVDLVTGESWDGTVPARNGVILVTEDQAKEITVNTADLAPAYDPAYIVSEKGREHTSHSYEKVVTDPTCTEDGYTTYTCACGDTYTGDEVPATGHTGGTATCTDKAVCSVCGNAYGELDADNHTGGTEVKGAVDATEEKDGYTGDTYCKGCGELLEKGETIGKLTHKHKMVKTPAKAATEYTEGNIEYYTCSDCGKIYKDAEGKEEITKADTVIAKLAHTHNLRKTAAKKATKYTQGNIEYYTCTKCGKIYKDAGGTKEIKLADTVIPKLTDNAATGDNSGILLWTMLLILSAAGVALIAVLIIRNRKLR